MGMHNNDDNVSYKGVAQQQQLLDLQESTGREGRGEFDDKKGWRMTAGPAGVEEGCEWAASA